MPRKGNYPLIPRDVSYALRVETHQSEVIRLALLAGDDAAIRDQEFVDCTIKGPAVIFLGDGARLDHNTLEGGPGVLWELDPAKQPNIVGAILIERTAFVGCTFTNVGIVGPKEVIDKFRQG
jgi:hypothetical protein